MHFVDNFRYAENINTELTDLLLLTMSLLCIYLILCHIFASTALQPYSDIK